MKSMEFDIKIGLFIAVGLILLTVITFSINDFFFKPGYNIYAVLGFANGVKKSAPVRLAGIEVGEVKEAGIFKDKNGKTMVRLKLWLTNDAKVEVDSEIIINTLGLIGEKYVEIIPGTPGGELLSNGDTVIGNDSVSVEQMTKKGYDVILKLDKAMDSMDAILRQVKNGNGTVGKLIYDDTIYNDVEALIKDIKAHPWKLLGGPRRVKQKTEDTSTGPGKSNFGPS